MDGLENVGSEYQYEALPSSAFPAKEEAPQKPAEIPTEPVVSDFKPQAAPTQSQAPAAPEPSQAPAADEDWKVNLGLEIEKLANPAKFTPPQQAQLAINDPELAQALQADISKLAHNTDLPEYPARAPNPKSYEQSAAEARNQGKPVEEWQNGWQVPARKKLAELTKYAQAGVNLNGLREPVLNGLYDLHSLAKRNGYELSIGSAADKHGPESHHFAGNAVDVNIKKNGEWADEDPKILELMKKWAWQSQFATLYDETHEYDSKGRRGRHKGGNAHFHLAWYTDAKNAPGAYQFFDRDESKEKKAVPHQGAKNPKFADVAPFLNSHDLKTPVGKTIRVAELEQLDPDIFARMISTESDFNFKAVSPVGAFGYAQLMPQTAAELANQMGVPEAELRNNEMLNLKAGARYLKNMLTKFDGNYARSLAAYNMGPGAMEAFLNGKQSLPRETRDYVYKILKEKDPQVLTSEKVVEEYLRKGLGPKLGAQKASNEVSLFPAEAARSYSQRFAELLRTAHDTFVGDVPKGEKSNFNLVGRALEQIPGLRDNKTFQNYNAALDSAFTARTGVFADIHNMLSGFVHTATPFHIIPDWRKQARKEGEVLMSGVMDEMGPGLPGWLMRGDRQLVTSTLPWLAGYAVGFSNMLKGAQLLGTATKNVPVIGGLFAGFSEAAAMEGSATPMITRYLNHTLKGKGNFVRDMAALGGLFTTNEIGTGLVEWMQNSVDGSDTRDFKTAAWDSIKHGMVAGGLMTLGSIAFPAVLQSAMSGLVRKPEMLGSVAQFMNSGSPAVQTLKRTGVGAVTAPVVGMGFINPIADLLGIDMDPGLREYATVGAGAGLLGSGLKMYGDDILKKMGGANSPVMQTISRNLDKWWGKLDDVYKNSFTDSAMSAAEAVMQAAEKQTRLAKAKVYSGKMRQTADELEPIVAGAESTIQMKQAELQKAEQQVQAVKQQVQDMQAQMTPEQQAFAQEFRQQASEKAQLVQRKAQVEEQLQQVAQNPNAPKQVITQIKASLNSIQNDLKSKDTALAEILKGYPQVLSAVKTEDQLAMRLKQFEGLKQNTLKEIEPIIPQVVAGRKAVTAFRQESDKFERLLKNAPETFDDPNFKYSTGNALHDLEMTAGEIPDYVPGINKQLIADTYNQVWRDSVTSLVDNFQHTGKYFDEAPFMLARKTISESAAKYGVQNDVAVGGLIETFTRKANSKLDDLAFETFGELGQANSKTREARRILQEQAIQYNLPGPRKRGTAAPKLGTVHADVILHAAKQQGFNLESPKLMAMADRVVEEGVKGNWKDASYLPSPAEIRPTGKTVKGRRTTHNNYKMNEDIVAQAMAAQRMGDAHVPVLLNSNTKAGMNDLAAWAVTTGDDYLNQLKQSYKEAGENLAKFSTEARATDVMGKMEGVTAPNDPGALAVLNKSLYEEQLSGRLLEEARELTNNPKLQQEDVLKAIHAKYSGKNTAPMLEELISQEVRLIGQLGQNIAGTGKVVEAGKAKTSKFQVGDVLFGKNETGAYVIDKDGKIQNRKMNFFTGGSGRQRLQFGDLAEDAYSDPAVMSAVRELVGSDASSGLNSEILQLQQTKDRINQIVESDQKLSPEQILGYVTETWSKQVYSRRNAMNEVASNLTTSLDDTLQKTYDLLPKNSAGIPAISKDQFLMDVVDTIEDFSKYKEFTKNYGDAGKQALSSILTATEAMTDWKRASPFLQSFARDSYSIHSFPERAAYLALRRGEEMSQNLLSNLDSSLRSIPTLAKARQMKESAEALIAPLGMTKGDFLKMSIADRARTLSPGLDWDSLSVAGREAIVKKVDEVSANLLLGVDLVNMTPGKLIGNRLKAMAHAEGVRSMVEVLSKTPTMVDGRLRYLIEEVSPKNPSAGQAFIADGKRRSYTNLSSSPMFHGKIRLGGQDVDTDKLVIHPEAMRFLTDYASKKEISSALQTYNEFNKLSSGMVLMGSTIPHQVQTTMGMMSDLLHNFMGGNAALNYSGAGRRLRSSERARAYELFAIRNGLNGNHIMENTVMISEQLQTMLGDDLSQYLMGTDSPKAQLFLRALDPRNPNRQKDYEALGKLGKGAADFFSVPMEIENALMKHVLFGQIRDAQLGAFYVRANQMMHEVPEIMKITDPLRRQSVAFQAASHISNKDVGAMPYFLFNKNFRAFADSTILTPGWLNTKAQVIVDGMSGILGLVPMAADKAGMPGVSKWLYEKGRSLVGGRPLYSNLPPEAREYIRKRMQKQVMGMVLGAAVFTEVFNIMVNGETSHSNPDPSKIGKLRVGDVYYSSPLFGQIRMLTNLFTASTGYAQGKSSTMEFAKMLFDQVSGNLSPVPKALAGLGGFGREEVAAGDHMIVEGNPLATAVNFGEKAIQAAVPMENLLGQQDGARLRDLVTGAKESRLTNAQYSLRNLFGIYDSRSNYPAKVRGRMESLEKPYNDELEQRVTMGMRRALAQTDPVKRQREIDNVKSIAFRGIPTKGEIAQYKPKVAYTPERWANTIAKYVRPADAAAQGLARREMEAFSGKMEGAYQSGYDYYKDGLDTEDDEAEEEDDF